MLVDIKITKHAIKRFREKTGCKSDEKAINTINKMLQDGEETTFKNGIWKTLSLLNHNFKEAKYYRYSQWILIIVENKLVSLHRGKAKRWN